MTDKLKCDYSVTICVNRFHQSIIDRPSKKTAYILYNRSISLLDFEGHLVGFILYKELSTNSNH